MINTIPMKLTRTKLLAMITLLGLVSTLLFSAEANDVANQEVKQNRQKDPKHFVVITYREPVDGFKVTIFWRPHEQMKGFLIGPAILEFKHNDPHKTFSVTNNRFGLPTSIDWFKTVIMKDGYFDMTSQPQIVMDYAVPKIADQLPDTPFFFIDLTFDGRKEVILTEIANGQRWRHTYQVHDINSVGLSKSSTIINQEPFASLDSESTIDFKNRTIILKNSSGAANSKNYLYRFVQGQGLNRYLLSE